MPVSDNWKEPIHDLKLTKQFDPTALNAGDLVDTSDTQSNWLRAQIKVKRAISQLGAL